MSRLGGPSDYDEIYTTDNREDTPPWDIGGPRQPVIGFDFSGRAIEKARQKGAELGLTNVRFEVADATDLSALDVQADVIADSGLLHSLDEDQQGAYLRQLESIAADDATLYVLSMSPEAGKGLGWPRFSYCARPS